MTEEEKKVITREKHLGRIAQGHKLAALMKKRKEEIFRNKERSTVQSTAQSTEQPTVQPMAQPSVKSNDTYIYGVGILAVLAIGVCVVFAYNTSENKKQANKKLDQPPKRCHML